MTTSVKAKAPMIAIEDVAAQAQESLEGIVKASQEQAAKTFEQTMVATKEQVEKASEQMMKGYDELAAIAKGNVDALVQSGTVVFKGAEDMSREVAAYARSSFDKSVAAGKAMLSAKSIQEVVELQNSFAKTSFDAFVNEATKLQEMSVKVANEAFAPINARMTATVEKFSKPMAA